MIAIIIILAFITIISNSIVILQFKKHRFKFPFKDTMGKSGLPIVSFEQNNKCFNFIIDSGSDNSMIKKSILNELNFIEVEGNKYVYGIDGNLIKVSFIGAELFSKNHKFLEIFQVMDVASLDNLEKECGIPVAGILGNSFFKRYGFIIDYNNFKAFTDGNMID